MTGFSTSPSLAYAGFSKEGPENLRIMKIKRKKSPLRFIPFSCPKLGEDKKQKKTKNVSLRLSAIFGSKLRDDQKKVTQMLFVFVLKLSAQVTKGKVMPQFGILFYANYTTLATHRGAMVPCPPLNMPLLTLYEFYCEET